MNDVLQPTPDTRRRKRLPRSREKRSGAKVTAHMRLPVCTLDKLSSVGTWYMLVIVGHTTRTSSKVYDKVYDEVTLAGCPWRALAWQ